MRTPLDTMSDPATVARRVALAESHLQAAEKCESRDDAAEEYAKAARFFKVAGRLQEHVSALERRFDRLSEPVVSDWFSLHLAYIAAGGVDNASMQRLERVLDDAVRSGNPYDSARLVEEAAELSRTAAEAAILFEHAAALLSLHPSGEAKRTALRERADALLRPSAANRWLGWLSTTGLGAAK